MSITDLFFEIANLTEESFAALEAGGNKVNLLIILIGTVLCIHWLLQMNKYNKKAAQEGSLK